MLTIETVETEKARFNIGEEVVEIIQLKDGVSTIVDSHVLNRILKYDFKDNNKIIGYCPKSNLKISYSIPNFHLVIGSNDVNVCLKKNNNNEKILTCLSKNYSNIKKTSITPILPQSQKNIKQITKAIKSPPIIKYAEYEEPHYDDANCNGYPDIDFLGIIGKSGETIEISFRKNDELFAPRDNRTSKDHIVSSGFNLYNQDRENLGWTRQATLICTYGKKHNVLEVKLLTTKQINYFGSIIEPYKPKQIAVGILPKPIKYVGYIDELLSEENLAPIAHVTDEEELPW